MVCRMVCRVLSGGLALICVSLLSLVPVAGAQERMQLGAPLGSAADFQAHVGDRVFFSDGSAELGARARTALEGQAGWLKRHPALVITIEAHADDMGTDQHNIAISRRRAEAVHGRLTELGVAAARIRMVVLGRTRLVADCRGAGCAAQNRRVVTVIGWPAGDPGRDVVTRRTPRRLY